MPIAPLRASPVRSGGLCCLFALTVACPAALSAQSLHSEPVDSFPKQTSIHWWQGAAVLGGVSALMLLDGTVRQDAQAHRTSAGDRFAESVRHFGQPEVYGTVTAGILTAGLVSHNPRLIRTGTRLAGALEEGASRFGQRNFVHVAREERRADSRARSRWRAWPPTA